MTMTAQSSPRRAALMALEDQGDDLHDVAALSSGRKLLLSVALERLAMLEHQVQRRDRRIVALTEETCELHRQLKAERTEVQRLRAFVMRADARSDAEAA